MLDKFKRFKYRLLIDYPIVEKLNRWLRPRNIVTFFLTSIRLKKYKQENNIIKLNIGGGRSKIRGWLNCDISYGDVYFNAIRRFPFRNEEVAYIFSEHFIEHIPVEKAQFFLKEGARTLKKGGVLRLSTPDLEFYVRLYRGEEKEVTLDMFCDRIRHIFPETPDQCSFFNRIIKEFGHKFNYDFNMLRKMCLGAGFSLIYRVGYSKSDYEELDGLEKHSSVKWYQDKASLIIEAVK